MTVTIQRAEARREDTAPRHEPHGADQATPPHVHKRRERRAAADGQTSLGRRVAFTAPLVLVTAAAVYGQIGYGLNHYSGPADDPRYKLVVAIVLAVTIESISNFVQAQSHRARLKGNTARAATLSRWSYAIALFVAFINYQHFCGPELAPTPAALVFALFSFSSPWLWGLYTRGAEDDQRAAAGTLDRAGAVFAAERWRSFPILTFRARRYSVMHNIVDPVEAWGEFMAEHRRGVTTRAIERRQHRDERRDVRDVRRDAGVKAGVTAGATGGAKPGATNTPQGGATGGATPVRTATAAASSTAPGRAPTRAPTVASLVRRTALTPAEQAAMRDAATNWAAAQAVRTGSVPGWRSIVGATDDRTGAPLFPGLTEYAAKTAAGTAKDRVPANGAPARAAR